MALGLKADKPPTIITHVIMTVCAISCTLGVGLAVRLNR